MHWHHVLGATLTFVFCCGLTYEFFRFKDALNVATQEHEMYQVALRDSICAKNPEVVSVEWRGQVLDCNVARLILLRKPRETAFMLWWIQGWFSGLYQRVAHNQLILTILIIAFIGFGMQMLANMHMNQKLTQVFDKFEHVQERAVKLLPAPQPAPRMFAPKRRVYEGLSDSE